MNKYFTHSNGSVSAMTPVEAASMNLGARARQEAFNYARARGEHAAPVYSVSVTQRPLVLDRALARELDLQGASFEFVTRTGA
ncbi:hypothetical protein [Variovorax atrisoli]|uniref:hypothetical protein n=1 Tax=Variovorax atrisoli TaxID=3394203 RepID=UPI0033941E8F